MLYSLSVIITRHVTDPPTSPPLCMRATGRQSYCHVSGTFGLAIWPFACCSLLLICFNELSCDFIERGLGRGVVAERGEGGERESGQNAKKSCHGCNMLAHLYNYKRHCIGSCSSPCPLPSAPPPCTVAAPAHLSAGCPCPCPCPALPPRPSALVLKCVAFINFNEF